MHPCGGGRFLFDDEIKGAGQAPTGPVARFIAEVEVRLAELSRDPRHGFVDSDLPVVHGALRRILDEDLARGMVFCEWGSGMGGVAALASLLSFEAYGIEIQEDLVDAARELAQDFDLDVAYAHGSFLLPGDEDVAAKSEHTARAIGEDAWRELGITPEGCDVVFVYPWPGEEAMFDELFLRHATEGALLMTFHDIERLLVQRKVDASDELAVLGWM